MSIFMKSDVVIIGGGITGAAIARELSRFDVRIILLEKCPDLAMGTTKANSAIIHSGYDPDPAYLKAKLNVAGNELYRKWQKDLNLEIRWTGTLTIAADEKELKTLQSLYERGLKNRVPGIELLPLDEVFRREPNLRKDIKGALWAPSGGVMWPFGVTLAMAENALNNGTVILTEATVHNIACADGRIKGVYTNHGFIEAPYVINAAGVNADEIARMAHDDSFTIKPRKGEYILFDPRFSDFVSTPLFPVPNEVSKGILVSPTIHGNVFVGPNSNEIWDRDDLSVSTKGMEEVIRGAGKFFEKLPLHASITQFAGIRAVADTNDFVIRESEVAKGLIHAAGMQSPGLSCAPAVAVMVRELLQERGLKLTEKKDYDPAVPARKSFTSLSDEEKAALIEKDPAFGRVICRCETVTEGEIVEAVRKGVGATTIDGVKRRVRAGMGRCQGGFCGPRVTAILARELDVPVTDIRKDSSGSYLFHKRSLPGSLKDAPVLGAKAGKKYDTALYDVAIIGGGPAGLAAAVSASDNGAAKIALIERDRELGGILEQCIHNGFGLHWFNEELTGPAYANRFIAMVRDLETVEPYIDTMVLAVHDREDMKEIVITGPSRGIRTIKAKTVILTMGCRERTRGAIRIPGVRSSGIFTAGAAQRMVNMEGYMPGKKIVILGSGDIGLIMARRLTLEGAKVQAVIEIMPYSNGLTRNIVQCLEDYDIPLYLSHTIIDIRGNDRVEKITCAEVDAQMKPREGTQFEIECDCVLLSVGLIPENELSTGASIPIDRVTGGPLVDESRQTMKPGYFAAGNVVHVHDLVDFVSEEGTIAGKHAAHQALGVLKPAERTIRVTPSENVRYVVPQTINIRKDSADEVVRLFFRGTSILRKVSVRVQAGDETILTKKEQIVKPSEMVVVNLPLSRIPQDIDEIRVSLEK